MAEVPAPQIPQPTSPVLQTSMASSLRRMTREVTVGTLISRSFEAWWRNFFRFAALLLLLFAVVGLLVAVPMISLARADAPRGAGLGPWILLPMLAAIPAMGVYLGGMSHGVIQHLAGQPVRLGAMLRTGLRRFLPVVGAAVLSYLATLVGFVLLIVPGILLALGLAMAPSVVVAEKVGPLQAMRRSWELSKGSRAAFFLAGLVLGVIVVAASTGTQLALTAAASPLAGAGIGLVIQVALTPLLYGLPAVLYHDLRVAKEGVPTEELARVFE